jgi:hypothetical protein
MKRAHYTSLPVTTQSTIEAVTVADNEGIETTTLKAMSPSLANFLSNWTLCPLVYN